MKATTVTCDQCQRDLATTGNCVDYRIALLNERIPSTGGFVTAMNIEPKLKQDYHFCGWKCLCDWMDATREQYRLAREKREAEQEWEMLPNGMLRQKVKD